MGMSTIIEINNDFLDIIEDNPQEFVDRLVERIQGGSGVMDTNYGRVHGVCHRDSELYKKFRELMEF